MRTSKLHHRIPIIGRPYLQRNEARRQRDQVRLERDEARRERDEVKRELADALRDRDAVRKERDKARDWPFHDSDPIYSVGPPGALVHIRSTGDSGTGKGALKGDRRRLELAAVAPPGAIIRLEPAQFMEDIQISRFESTEAAIEDGLNYKFLSLDVIINAPQEQSYVALNLVDMNPNSPVYGKNPISPIACICVPLEFEWYKAAPGGNITRTCGALPQNSEAFAAWGLSNAYQIHALANRFLGRTTSLTILDWGIGTGRVAVPLKRVLCPDSRVFGVDVDPVNAEWCIQNYTDIETCISDFFPPLDLPSSSIDLVYGISVMTHLTEGAQYAWLKELKRILKPGGLCILTTHGEYAFLRNKAVIKSDLFSDSFIEQLQSIGISDMLLDGNLGPQLNMRNYYRSTFQTRVQIEEQWSKFLNLAGYYPAGLSAHQDIVVMKK